MYQALNYRFTVVWMSLNDISSKDRNNLTDKISLISRMVGRYDKRGGDMGHGLNQLHKVQPSDFCTDWKYSMCVYAMCTLGWWEGMMREREGRVGWTSFTKYKPSDFCTVRMYTLYNLKHQQYEKYFLLPPLPTHLHPLYLFPSITPIHMYCLYCVLYKSTNFIIGNFLYFYK